MISYKNISLVFNDKILLSGFNLDVAKNEKVILWGRSGSGKSSLLSMIPGFLIPTEGVVSVAGKQVNPKNIQQIRNKIAWLPQEAALPFEFIRDLIASPFGYKANKDKQPAESVIFEYFDQLGLDAVLYEKRVNEVSGGELQRIMIVMAALLRKEILLLDEPTSALDGESIEKLIRFLHNMKDTTMLAISHDKRFAESFDKQIKIA